MKKDFCDFLEMCDLRGGFSYYQDEERKRKDVNLIGRYKDHRIVLDAK